MNKVLDSKDERFVSMADSASNTLAELESVSKPVGFSSSIESDKEHETTVNPAAISNPAEIKKDQSEPVVQTLQAASVTVDSAANEAHGAASRLLRLNIRPEHVSNLVVSTIALSAGIALWHWATLNNLNIYINFENVPSPAKVFVAFWNHLQTEVFFVHIGVSMRRILISYSLAVVVGVVIGLLMGRSAFARAFIMPYIEIVRPIPAVAWIPLAILMWPTEEASIIYITYLGALFPIVINTMHGVEQTPEVLVRAAKSLGASRLNIFWHVVLPAALPSISAGLAIGMGVSWFSLLAGEIISGQYGIGYFTWNAYSLINYQDIVVGMLVIGFLGTLSTLLVKSLTRPFLRWQTKVR